MSLYCSKCGCYPTYSSGCCICGSNQLSFDENKSTKTYPAADVERLVEACKEVLADVQHISYCNAIKGPEHETWTVEEDCDCVFKQLKSALDALRR